ncbi:MAG: tRNA (adenosine(37)-N6)-threonylcarbamoyltransferase complex dimerization subunit type 1 TsaB [Alphaproteobacteria bacterium]|nr:tRNA (adenosine(37)-N6)-threonylcarbamoyltransferase complex dimerization subunit type 1 TsaB [Alphaproteobacteria bacterium]MCY4319039.1 tRNA (adenosine(37)-N6)-threonylcarbamoyltransferase complex dimerization subunit type 1 TsaB [Alphaproteobacteria bacterium]
MVELALDCAANACSVAVARDGKLLAARWRPMARGHAEMAPVMLERVMAEAGVLFADLSRIVVTRGPGSFTGIRIALAAARGLALVTKAELVAASTFEALRPALPPEGRLFAVLNTGRGSLYAAELSGAATPFATTMEALVAEAPFAVTGDAGKALAASAPGAIRALAPALPDAVRLLGRHFAPGPASPLYLSRPLTGPVGR